MRPLLLASLLLFASTATPAQSRDDEAERRWEFVAGSDVQYLVGFIRQYPDSPRVAQARAILEASDAAPLARLVDPAPACRALVDERARSLLDDDLKDTPPAGYFESSPRWVAVPGGGDPAAAPIEQRFTLSLVASPAGECSLIIRWRYGSGLGDACRCEPIEPGYVFPSRLASRLLDEHARFRGGAQACGLPTEEADAYLAEATRAYGAKAAAQQARLEAGGTLFPTEEGEMKDIAHALSVLAKAGPDEGVALRERARVEALPDDVRGRFCGQALPGLMAEARMRLVMLQTQVRSP